MKYVIVLGTGGFAREVLWLIREINRAAVGQSYRKPPFKVLGFVEEGTAAGEGEMGGFPVLGDDEWAIQELDRSVLFVPAYLSPGQRLKRSVPYLQAGFRPATLIHPSVCMGEDVALGQGCVISAGAVMTSQVEIGQFGVVLPNATLAYDVRLGDWVTVHPGANLGGGASLGDGVEVRAGAVVEPGVALESGVVLPAGAVASEDMEAKKA